MPSFSSTTDSPSWWRGGVIYNAYPRSWRDANGDGIGDLAGIAEGLDYLAWLGIDGLWLSPIMPSPNHDWGYDVADYRSIHPDFGDTAQFDHLLREASNLGIHVLLDLVPSHTSDEHHWFVDARSSKAARYRDYYVWHPPASDGGPPNNWLSYFGEPAWTLDERSGEYYLHTFSPHQPKLNWWNPAVREEFDSIFCHWFDRGVSGMRIDALQTLLHDPTLRDNPPSGRSDTTTEQALGQRFTHSANRPEVHSLIRHWRKLADNYSPPQLLFGETWVPSLSELVRYYGNGHDELDLAWNLPFLQSAFTAPTLRAVVDQTLTQLPAHAWPAWAISTHDADGRAATRWCHGDVGAIRCALLLLIALQGTPVLYYGDEIGMVQPPAAALAGTVRDLVETGGARDASRTPMQWSGAPGAGFTTSPEPWLPVIDAASTNVADQRVDPSSTLHFCRDLIAMRRRTPALAMGLMRWLPSAPGVLAWERGTEVVVAVNLGSEVAPLSVDGVVSVCTDRVREGTEATEGFELRPNEGVLLTRG